MTQLELNNRLYGRSDNINISEFKLLSQAVQDDIIAYFLEKNKVNINYRLVEELERFFF